MARQRVPSERPGKDWDDLQRLMNRCFLRQIKLGFKDQSVLMQTLEFMDKKIEPIQNRWPSKEEALGFKASFDSFRDEVVGEALRRWREFRHSKILAFLEPALDFDFHAKEEITLEMRIVAYADGKEETIDFRDTFGPFSYYRYEGP